MVVHHIFGLLRFCSRMMSPPIDEQCTGQKYENWPYWYHCYDDYRKVDYVISSLFAWNIGKICVHYKQIHNFLLSWTESLKSAHKCCIYWLWSDVRLPMSVGHIISHFCAWKTTNISFIINKFIICNFVLHNPVHMT